MSDPVALNQITIRGVVQGVGFRPFVYKLAHDHGLMGWVLNHSRGVDIEVNLLKKIRLEIAVNEAFVQPTIDAIVNGAKTGTIGDGKIFVLPLERCVRIRTGEEGNDAIG